MAAFASSSLVREWAYQALSGLGDARAEIDALNVFPVPDGDTGTNLYLTMESACESVDRCWMEAPGGSPGLSIAAKALSTGALLGARGNSGVILSQMLRGTSDVLGALPEGEALGADAVLALLRRAADLGYEAVARPVEGTILTVARAAADAAQASLQAGADDAATVVQAGVQGARDALALTPTMLESLRLAGVVDAGGQGLLVVLDALAEVVSGVRRSGASSTTGLHLPVPRPVHAEVGAHYAGPAYEVMFLLEAQDDAVATLRVELDTLGDSLVMVGGDALWNVHVHVDDAGAAVEAAIRAGRPYRFRITHLQPAGEAARRVDIRAIVAVSHGPGVAELLERSGVHVVPAAPRQRPSTAEILGAVRLSHATEVVILPSDKDTRAVAEAAAEQARGEGVRVSVVPTRSVVQTLAAVAVHDASMRFDDDVVSMTRAAGATRYAAVTIASRRALTTVGPCEVGDVLGLVDGDIFVVGSDLAEVAREILTAMLAIGGELVTLVPGQDAGDDLRVDLPAWAADRFPLTDVVVHDGGQPLWPLIMGVE
ncbi:MAG: DAK2 domain-containing protein [Actinobacteria bacterium]|nr:DAK2 domain-containing protein [Actinomycetota bacterium]